MDVPKFVLKERNELLLLSMKNSVAQGQKCQTSFLGTNEFSQNLLINY